MRLNENRPLAWVVLAACALTSVVGLGGGSLARARDDALNTFYSGAHPEETTRSSMDAYLDRAADCAQIMAAEAQLYLGEDNAVALHARDAIARFGDDDGLDSRYEAYTQLQQDSDDLYNAIYAADLTDEQRVNFKRAYDDFWGCDKYIRKDPYREMAVDFNESLKDFPAGAVAKLLNLDELNSFGAG